MMASEPDTGSRYQENDNSKTDKKDWSFSSSAAMRSSTTMTRSGRRGWWTLFHRLLLFSHVIREI